MQDLKCGIKLHSVVNLEMQDWKKGATKNRTMSNNNLTLDIQNVCIE